MHPGPGAMPSDPPTLAAAVAVAAAAESDGGDGADGADDAAAAAEKPSAASGGRQTRRRWRLLQYLLGWLEGAALEGDGVGGGGSRGSPEMEEALAAATVALVGVTCPGPPAAEERTTGVAAGRRRPFLIQTGDPPCPIVAGPFVAGGDRGEGLIAAGGAAIADGVWGGALDNLGPFLRYSGEAATSTGRGWAAATARAVWGFDAAGGSAWGGGGDLPTYVDFMAPTLKECGASLMIFVVVGSLPDTYWHVHMPLTSTWAREALMAVLAVRKSSFWWQELHTDPTFRKTKVMVLT